MDATTVTVIGSVIVAAVGGGFAWLAAKGKGDVDREAMLNTAFGALLKTLQDEHASCLARVAGLNDEIGGHQERIRRLESALMKNGIEF